MKTNRNNPVRHLPGLPELFNKRTLVLTFNVVGFLSFFLFYQLLSGCGTITQVQTDSPKDGSMGFGEFSIDDNTRWLANGWTVPISETVNGAKKKYGFLGRDVLWAPANYSKVRRIPLSAGHHSIDLLINGTGKQVTVEMDVVQNKVTPIVVQIDRQGSHMEGSKEIGDFLITCTVGAVIDP